MGTIIRRNPKHFKILILPSGGATGIISSTILARLEKDLGRPIYQNFDEIWTSSIGAMIGALLTTRRQSSGLPYSAEEVTEFLKNTFASFPQALGIRGSFKDLLPASMTMKETLIPLRVLAAEILKSKWLWPSETRLRSFSSEQDRHVSLASVVSASCTVFPLHPAPERVQLEDGRWIKMIDAGCEVCTQSCMNPLEPHFKEFLREKFTSQDTLAFYFISTGWIRMEPLLQDLDNHLKNQRVGDLFKIQLFNVDADLCSVIRDWRTSTRVGGVLGAMPSESILCNLAGAGFIPTKFLLKEAERVYETSEVCKKLVHSISQPE